MTNIKDSNALQFSYILVTISWLSSLIGIILVPALFLFTLLSDSALASSFTLNFPISTDVILFSPENTVSFMDIDSAMASAQAGYVADNYFWSFFAVALIATIAALLIFYTVHQTRNLLKDIRKNEIFTHANTNRIKKIAIAILALSPMRWLYHLSLISPFESYLQENSVAIEVGSADFGLISIGLLNYILALIFERGQQQYDELRHTV
ncbi:DUF2975 domain-containing protein [Balneola sp. MJW-20]|uniref:DUF2975 domain-containing protein n=1 Tax=Gracilimonas aurantiaca TaxID=3234185 RepID=UPI0034672CA9